MFMSSPLFAVGYRGAAEQGYITAESVHSNLAEKTDSQRGGPGKTESFLWNLSEIDGCPLVV